MIEAGYVRTMARYNAWQNRQLTDVLKTVDDAVLRQDRGAFFGSIMNTLNHLLWADTIWMSRFDARIPPPPEGTTLATPSSLAVVSLATTAVSSDNVCRVVKLYSALEVALLLASVDVTL